MELMVVTLSVVALMIADVVIVWMVVVSGGCEGDVLTILVVLTVVTVEEAVVVMW